MLRTPLGTLSCNAVWIVFSSCSISWKNAIGSVEVRFCTGAGCICAWWPSDTKLQKKQEFEQIITWHLTLKSTDPSKEQRNSFFSNYNAKIETWSSCNRMTKKNTMFIETEKTLLVSSSTEKQILLLQSPVLTWGKSCALPSGYQQPQGPAPPNTQELSLIRVYRLATAAPRNGTRCSSFLSSTESVP